MSEICEEYTPDSKLKPSFFSTILTDVNPLFWVDEYDRWHCSWDPKEMSIQTSRVMSSHFNRLAYRTGAWWGTMDNLGLEVSLVDGDEKGDSQHLLQKKKFNLPWQEEWRESFLESSRFLSRERYCDEAAQRLLYRLNHGLKKRGYSFDDVKVLACVTAPAMLLSTALHRWWPTVQKPVVVDLSFHILLGKPARLPAVVNVGGIVVVQDILEHGRVSGNLVSKLREQSEDVLCVIGLVSVHPEMAGFRSRR